MAHQLIHEVYEHAPADLTQAELNVLVVIAYHSLAEQRQCWMQAEDMQHRTRQTGTALRQTMQRLAKRGLECRVAHSMGKDGRPVYAHRGRATTYRLPDLAAPPGCVCTRHPGNKGDTHPGKGDTQNPPEGAFQTSPSGRKGDIPQPEGAFETSPYRPEGDVSQPEGACETSPFEEEGDVSQLKRRLSDVALNGRTGKKEGGTTEVTTGPHARETNQPPPRTRSRPRAEAPGQLPLTAVVRNDPPAEDRDVEAIAVPAGSLCRRADCHHPADCGACGRARAAGPVPDPAQLARQALIDDRDRARVAEARRVARERAAAAQHCPWGCVEGYDATQVCDHQRWPTGSDNAEWRAARDRLRHRRTASPDGPTGGRHRAAERYRAS